MVGSWARRQLAARSLRLDLSWRQPPRLQVHPAGGSPAVYYLVPHLAQPSGGVKVMYRHVDLLNDMGIPAAVLHEPHGFRCTWFGNDTRIVSPQSIRLRRNDILVVPECYGPGFGLLPPEVPKFVFNQGAYHTFDLIDLASTEAGAPYAGMENLRAILSVSRDNAELLRFTFPEVAVFGTRPVIDPKLFHRAAQPGKRRLAFVPSRRAEERHQLMHMLRARGVDWEMTPIRGMSETEVASTMRDSAVFLSFSEREGFGLPPAEAMASGCYVIGYDGGGGREYFDPAYSCPVTDQMSFAKAVLEATSRDPVELAALGAKASEHVLGAYTADGLRQDLAKAYGQLV